MPLRKFLSRTRGETYELVLDHFQTVRLASPEFVCDQISQISLPGEPPIYGLVATIRKNGTKNFSSPVAARIFSIIAFGREW
jgi:hypothetical protein